MTRLLSGALLVLLLACVGLQAQAGTRRLTTIDAIRRFASYYHLQSVLLRGELAVDGRRTVIRANDRDLRVRMDDGVSMPEGVLEVRGLLLDVGRLDPGDPRVGEEIDPSNWPRPGEDLLLRVSGLIEVSPITAAPTIRSIAIEPWRFEGEAVTVVGNFRGRNLFGDLADAPGNGRYDFVLRGTEGAVWVTGLRPRGRGFDLDVDRRVDTGQWLEVTGTVVHEGGLVRINATRLLPVEAPALSDEPQTPPTPVVPPAPVDVIFSVPTDRDIDVGPAAPVRIQFSRGLNEASLQGRIRATYMGQPAAEEDVSGLTFTITYDAASRAVQLTPDTPLEAFRTVRVELLEGITGFDGAPVTPWTLTFSVGR